MAGRPWTKEEVDFVKNNFVEMSCKEMATKLPNRTTRAVQHLFNHLGLERPQPKVGDKIGRLEILELYLEQTETQQITMARARCECGTEKRVRLTAMTQGTTVSCGCWKNENASKRMSKMNRDGLGTHIKHGLCKHKLYICYYQMMNRCYLESATGYENYGGRGIRVCDKWKEGFLVFYEWGISHGWKPGLTIERENVNGDYCPANCRFATMKEQGANRRNTIQVTAWNESKPLVEWLKDARCKVTYGTLITRIKDYGWCPEKAISEPPLR